MAFTALTTLKQLDVFTSDALVLENGVAIGPITVGYEDYGQLNAQGDNCILIAHALTGTSHVAQHDANDVKGWWDYMVGPDKLIDTNKYYVICSNFFGGYSGTTGPSSINPLTQQPYRLSFPGFCIRDIINVQKALLDALGVQRLVSVIGGSLGGMQATQWAIDYPDFVASSINIASPLAIGPDAIGYNLIQRMAILNDPNFNNGNYIDQPHGGLATARMLGMMTYRTSELFAKRFERFTVASNSPDAFAQEYFEIESYLRYQGNSFVERFDANSYLYLTKVMDLFDVTKAQADGSIPYQRISCPYLIIAITADQLFRINDLRRARQLLTQAKIDLDYCEIDSEFGHDAFLVAAEAEKFIQPIGRFLAALDA